MVDWTDTVDGPKNHQPTDNTEISKNQSCNVYYAEVMLL